MGWLKGGGLISILLLTSSWVEAREVDWERVEMVLVAEAADQGNEGMLAVGCVMRNRGWDLNGFSGAKRADLVSFYNRQPLSVREGAKGIIVQLREGHGDITDGATHYENLRAFGEPSWWGGMRVTRVIGDHTFAVEDGHGHGN